MLALCFRDLSIFKGQVGYVEHVQRVELELDHPWRCMTCSATVDTVATVAHRSGDVVQLTKRVVALGKRSAWQQATTVVVFFVGKKALGPEKTTIEMDRN